MQDYVITPDTWLQVMPLIRRRDWLAQVAPLVDDIPITRPIMLYLQHRRDDPKGLYPDVLSWDYVNNGADFSRLTTEERLKRMGLTPVRLAEHFPELFDKASPPMSLDF